MAARGRGFLSTEKNYLMATKKNSSQRKVSSKNVNELGAEFTLKKRWFLDLSILFFIFALSQLGEVQKSHGKEPANYKFFMTAFIISIAISFLFLGIYFGIWIGEKKATRNTTHVDVD
jgi:hypothetical protein